MTFTVPTIFKAVDKMSNVLRGIGNSVQSFAAKAESGLSRAERTFRKLTPSLSNAAKQLIGFSAAAAVAFAGSFGARSILEYETALKSLQAVTGVSDKQMIQFKSEIASLAKVSKASSIDIAASFETIGSNMSQYLSDPKGLRQIAEAGITLAKAGRTELQPTLESLTSVMNQFQLKAAQAGDTINRLTAGEIVGSVRTSEISEMLQDFGASAYNANVKLSESVTLIEVLGRQLKHDKIGVGARNIISILDAAKGLDKKAVRDLKSAGVNTTLLMDRTKSLGERLHEISKIKGDAVKMVSVFGRENLTAGQVILNNLGTYDEWLKQIESTNKANEQAAKNSETLAKKLTEVKNSFVNALVEGDQFGSSMDYLKKILSFVANNMGTILKIALKLILAFAAIKTILLVLRGVMIAYNVILGITGALSSSASIAIGANSVALAAYSATTKIAAAAQWLLNIAMSANPIGLIIIAITALIAIVVVVIKKWNEWGAAISLLMGPLGFVISLIQSFRRNWDMIEESFKKGGILGGLKAIGAVILDAILMPMQQVVKLIANATGAQWAKDALVGFDVIRKGLGVNVSTDENGEAFTPKPAVNPALSRQESLKETVNTQKVSGQITIEDQTGKASVSQSAGSGLIPISLSSTKR